MTITFVFIGIFIASYFGVALFLRWSLKKQLLDIPNERSSHAAPTPRGGGVVIVAVSLISYLAYCLYGGHPILWGYVAGAALISLISWLDDVYSISFVWRFLVHSVAAGLVIYDAGAWQNIYLPVLDTRIELGTSAPSLPIDGSYG